MQSPEKGKAKRNPARARRVARKEKKATQAKVTVKRQQSTRASRVSVETVESMDTKHLIVGTSSRPNLKAQARAQGDRNQPKATAVNKVEETPDTKKRLYRNQVCLK